jgi:hypothetical protein
MRLTKQIKENIVRQETSRIFTDKENSILLKLITLCEDRVKSSIPSIPENLIEAGYFSTSNKVKISGMKITKKGSTSLRGNRFNVRIDDNRTYVHLQNYYPIPRYNSYFCIDDVREIKRTILALNELRCRIYDFNKKLNTALNSVNTSKQLIDLLPELKDYVSDEKSVKALIPVEQIKDLRSILRKKG